MKKTILTKRIYSPTATYKAGGTIRYDVAVGLRSSTLVNGVETLGAARTKTVPHFKEDGTIIAGTRTVLDFDAIKAANIADGVVSGSMIDALKKRAEGKTVILNANDSALAWGQIVLGEVECMLQLGGNIKNANLSTAPAFTADTTDSVGMVHALQVDGGKYSPTGAALTANPALSALANMKIESEMLTHRGLFVPQNYRGDADWMKNPVSIWAITDKSRLSQILVWNFDGYCNTRVGIMGFSSTPVAKATPFDNTTNGFTSTDVQAAIEEVKASSGSGGTATRLIVTVYNQSGVTVTNGSIVWIDGSHGFLPTIALSRADIELTSSRTAGVILGDIPDQNSGTMVVAGIAENLDTHLLTEGVQLYLSPTNAGEFTTIKPTAPDHLVYVGICTRSHPTFGTIEVSIQNGYQLDELHDIIAVTPNNGDILRFVSSTATWNQSSSLSTLESLYNSNNAMGMRIVPAGNGGYSIGLNYESVITDRMKLNGRLILKGKLTILK